jgi:alpha-tubulin suppressor-like RCC1 family protein
LGYIAGGRVYICGAFGERIIENFCQLTINEEIVDMRLGEKSGIFLTRKGEIYQLGEFYKENGERVFSEAPKKIEKLGGVRQIFGGMNSFFAISENKVFYGWGQNEYGQISGTIE